MRVKKWVLTTIFGFYLSNIGITQTGYLLLLSNLLAFIHHTMSCTIHIDFYSIINKIIEILIENKRLFNFAFDINKSKLQNSYNVSFKNEKDIC